MEPLWLAIAFVFGFGARRVGLPPLVGYLVAGFVLHGLGARSGGLIDEVADIGVLLMLFSIGLKLHLRTLARPVIWAGATIHMAVTVAVLAVAVFGLARAGLPVFAGLSPVQSVLIAFALSFSSTVFAVKVLEDKGEMGSQHGKTAIGILIMQDVVAIVFLTASKGEFPSLWSVALVAGLLLLRPLLGRLMERSGHGELLILYGLVLTLGAAALFDTVGLKADLGALVIGVLLAGNARAPELAKTLLDVKDLLLVGFFLSVGLAGTPSLAAVGVAALLCIAVPFKTVFFFWLLARFRLRARNAYLAALSLANYSEFGLIVGAVGYKEGWISAEWMIVLAIAVALTFILASPVNGKAHTSYEKHKARLIRHQTADALPEDRPVETGAADVVVVGMAPLGQRAYDTLRDSLGDRVVGLERSPARAAVQREAGRNVICGDSTDLDFYERLERHGHLRLVLLTLANHQENLTTARLLRGRGYDGLLAGLARHDDEVQELRAAGVGTALDLSVEAGAGFARRVLKESGLGGARPGSAG